MLDLEIKFATVSDAKSVGKLVYQLLCELVPSKYGPEKLGVCETAAGTMLDAGKLWAFLAYDENEAIGVLTLHEGHAIYAEGAFGEVSELFVSPEYRSHKIGHRLIDAAVEFATSKNWSRLEVGAPDLPRWQRTVDFYKSRGFHEIGPRLEMPI